tara:strand:+ start:201 stop:554 length:354 start_codon:yes stop_codon:yes gene_type:complete
VGTQAKRACVKSGSTGGEVMNESNDLRCFSEQYQIKALEDRIESLETRIIHRGIHHEDAIDGLTIRLANVLEGELKTVLEKALVANSKGKANVVGYQIEDALRVLSRELSKLTEEKS